MKRPRTMMRGCYVLAVVASTALGIESPHQSPVRRVQGFGVGVVVDPVPAAPLPTPVSPTTSSTTARPVSVNISPAPSTLSPSLAVRAVETPRPSLASTGGVISLGEDTLPPSTTPLTAGAPMAALLNTTVPLPLLPDALNTSDPVPLLPYALNFTLEFQIAIQAGVILDDVVDELEASLTEYLSMLELSLDTEQTRGPLQVIGTESTILEACSSFSPDFLCQIVRMAVSARVSERTKYSDLIVSQLIRNNFVARFEAKSSDRKIVYEYPIMALGVLRYALRGPTREMDATEKGYFAGFAERRVVEPIFNEIVDAEYSLRSVDWRDEYPFTLDRDASVVVNGNAGEVGQARIFVQIFVLATCRNEKQCTSSTFQDYMEQKAIPKSESLTAAITGIDGEMQYFSQIEELKFLPRGSNETFEEEVGENLTPATPNNNSSRASTTTTKQPIPLWVWMLIIVDFAVLVGVFGYISHRRNKRRAQGGDKTQHFPEEPKQNRRMSMQVTPFTNRPKQGQQVAKTAQQIQEDECDAHSYDFSVEAGELSEEDSEIDLSSFRRPRTTRRF